MSPPFLFLVFMVTFAYPDQLCSLWHRLMLSKGMNTCTIAPPSPKFW